jgi:hypothetical protein
MAPALETSKVEPSETPQEPKEEEIESDQRTVSAAAEIVEQHRIWQKYEKMDPAYLHWFKLFETPKKMMVYLLLVLVLLSKPGWCEDLSNINRNCMSDSNGVQYDTLMPVFISSSNAATTIGVIMFLILLMQFCNMFFINSRREAVVFIVLTTLWATLIFAGCLKVAGVINNRSLLFICSMAIWAFYVATDEFLTTGIWKSLKVIWDTKLSSFIYLFMLGFFTILIRLLTWDSEWIFEDDAPFYTTSKWTTWYNALHSWWLITLEDVFPDCTYLF